MVFEPETIADRATYTDSHQYAVGVRHVVINGEPDQIFTSYAHEDAFWRGEFERMLAPAEERGLIRVCSDGSIAAGEDWSKNIHKALESSRVGLLLVTDHFLQSQFITRSAGSPSPPASTATPTSTESRPAGIPRSLWTSSLTRTERRRSRILVLSRRRRGGFWGPSPDRAELESPG